MQNYNETKPGGACFAVHFAPCFLFGLKDLLRSSPDAVGLLRPDPATAGAGVEGKRWVGGFEGFQKGLWSVPSHLHHLLFSNVMFFGKSSKIKRPARVGWKK